MKNSIPAFHSHDHSGCAADILSHAETRAKEQGLRLTPVRRRVLEILAESHQALGAYDVLERLRADGFGNQPPVAYRALDFLVDNGMAHRITRLNAFAACTKPNRPGHAPVFLICSDCDAVAELSGTQTATALREESQDIGFQLERMNIEAVGLCPKCVDRHDASD
jgi:Fur family zinc uptake transcriptional regulator